MPRPLNEQVVVITGASSGMGRAAARKFGAAGASVVLAARNPLALESAAIEVRTAGGQAHVVVTDVSEWDQMQHLAQEAIRVFGRIDTWVNAAAVSMYATIDQIAIDEIDRIVQVNLLGVIYGVKAVLPHMMSQKSGTIINFGSVVSWRTVPLQLIYSATKHGVKGFTEGLRMELEHHKSGINVTTILPTSINTPFFSNARSKMGVRPSPIPPVYSPELAADAVVYAAQHPTRDMYIGGTAFGFTLLERLSPALMDRLLMFGDLMFRLQQTKTPDTGISNLFEPVPGAGRVEGDFAHLTKPSLFTPLVEMTPAAAKLPLLAFAAGVFAFVTMKRR